MKALVAALLVLAMSGSWAGLGGAPSQAGPRALAAQISGEPTGRAAYSDVQRKLESGTIVHEYVDAGGVVFAVSWSGPYLPDLKQLLGSYFDAMVAQASSTARAGRSQLSLRRSDLVIVSGGHMGAFEGRAWLPGKLPPGFSPADIK